VHAVARVELPLGSALTAVAERLGAPLDDQPEGDG
jgi:hypothetical protein